MSPLTLPLPVRRVGAVLAAVIALTAVSRAAAEAADLFAFNGRDLTGFTNQNHGNFSVQDGAIVVDHGTGWLRSDATFGDFQLLVEVRFDEPQANSGIFVRTGPTSHSDDNGWPDQGYQVQCMDTAGGEHPLGTLINYGGSDFDQVFDPAIIAAVIHPTGDWNLLDIICRGDRLAVRLNGTLITLVQGIARPTGHVGIQGEHGALHVRKFVVRALD